MRPTGAAPPYDAVIFAGDAVLADGNGRPRLSAAAADLAGRLRAGGVSVALVTTGRLAPSVVGYASSRFDVVVDKAGDGTRSGSGAALADAARRMNAPAGRVAVVQATATGVADARAGGFGLIVGIARTSSRSGLETAGADLVLNDVSELDLGVLRSDPWVLAYQGYDPAHEGHREALTTLGNGYLGTRGAAPERSADGVHYPGSYLAGTYNRLTSVVQGRTVEDEHLVNIPNWLPVDLRTEGGAWWSEGGFAATQERRELDLRRGVLTRQVQLVDATGRRLQVTQRRLVSMQRPHLAALETTVVPVGWNGGLEVRSGVDASVTNSNVAEYADLADRHLGDVTCRQVEPHTLLVEAVTRTSRITVAAAARTVVTGARVPTVHRMESILEGRYAHRLDVAVREGEPVRIDKTVAVVTSRDRAIANAGSAALDELDRSPAGVTGLLPGHEAAWERLWHRFEVDLDADRDTQLVLNLHLFHLLQSVSPHTAEVDAGVPARGLHGEGYRGHVFWDELFVLPVVTPHLPAVARALLDYRWRRLGAARQAAVGAGLAGALFPWQSGSDGREETPTQLFSLRSGRWIPDNSRRQRHVGLAVAYNAWQYYQATGDTGWLAERGTELIIEVTRMFAALAAHDPVADRFHITGVMGPDEYHDGYPDAPGAGLRDNAYTNVLTAWVCARALDTLSTLAGHDCDDVRARFEVSQEEEARWEHMSRRLAVPFHADGVISQFDGYDRLAELDWGRYRATYGNIGRLDLILEAEGDSTTRYKLAKQADVLMLFYLLGADEVREMLRRLGYSVHPDLVGRTIDYYLARTAHGSTLSRVTHSSVLAGIDSARAWVTFREALVADLDDTQGGTTREGVHLGAMAGTVDIITRSFAGLQLRDDTLTFHPCMPDELRRIRFQVQYRGQRIDVVLDHARIRLSAHLCAAAPPVCVHVAGADAMLGGGETLDLEIRPTAALAGPPSRANPWTSPPGERSTTATSSATRTTG